MGALVWCLAEDGMRRLAEVAVPTVPTEQAGLGFCRKLLGRGWQDGRFAPFCASSSMCEQLNL